MPTAAHAVCSSARTTTSFLGDRGRDDGVDDVRRDAPGEVGDFPFSPS